MHVDGFRFDLASVFSRNENGEPMLNPPIIWDIDSDPILAGTKLIAEAWDVGGLYQVGSFGADKWKEWNGQFRDDIRSFVKGDTNSASKLRERITGCRDLYSSGNRPAGQSITFVTCHDGFTLNDLVSYDNKHNEANRELNSDGTNANLSWNCGFEGCPLILISSNSEKDRSRIFWHSRYFQSVRRCCSWGTKYAGHSLEITTHTARTTR